MWCIFSFGHEHVSKIPSMHSITDSSLHGNIMTLGSGYILIYVCLIYYCVMASHILYLIKFKTIMTMFYECVYMYVPDIHTPNMLFLIIISLLELLALKIYYHKSTPSQPVLSGLHLFTMCIMYYVDTMCELVVIAIWI